MSMKQEIETWVAALAHYDQSRYEDAIEAFRPIADTSKILFNCGVIRASTGEHGEAVRYYQRALLLDQYLAIAYFQQGVSNFLLGNFEEALSNFNDTLLYLRGNRNIDYEQLGLKFKLHSCEALFNRGLCYIYLQQVEAGMSDLEYAAKEKAAVNHDVIDEAIGDRAKGYTVFSIPVGLLFRPSEAKVKNVRVRDYLGKARLVATAADPEIVAHRKKMAMEQWARDDRPADRVSYAATNLVIRSNIRTRQQSEPPLHRNFFPPTPPPETEKPGFSRPQRIASPDRGLHVPRSRSLSRRPEPLDLGRASFDQPQSLPEPPVRPLLVRSASERQAEKLPERPARSPRHKYEQSKDRLDSSAPPQSPHSPHSPSRSLSKSHTFPRQMWPQRPASIEEEDEGTNALRITVPQPSSASSYPGSPSDASPSMRARSKTQTLQRLPLREAGPVSLIRLKVHVGDDTRYFTINPTTDFSELSAHVAKKFGTRSELRIRTRDEDGDMITMADQEDLDTAIAMSLDMARREGRNAAKMEVWISEA